MQKALSIIAEVLDVNASEITEQSLVNSFPQWDSLAFIQIISQLEAGLGISIPIEKVIGDAATAVTVGELLQVLGTKAK